MKSHPRIAKIVEVRDFTVKLLWDTTEVRIIDFKPLFEGWKGDPNLMKLNNRETFQKVSLSDTGSLCWKNVLTSFSFRGVTHSEPLELDTDELYRQSKEVPQNEATIVRMGRSKAGNIVEIGVVKENTVEKKVGISSKGDLGKKPIRERIDIDQFRKTGQKDEWRIAAAQKRVKVVKQQEPGRMIEDKEGIAQKRAKHNSSVSEKIRAEKGSEKTKEKTQPHPPGKEKTK